MRSISDRFKAALFKENTDEVTTALITITHPDLPTTLRFSSNPSQRLSTEPLAYGTISRGETFDYVPMKFTLPADQDDAPPTIDIIIVNVGRETVPLLRSTLTPASVTVEIILDAYPDDVEATFPEFDLVSAPYEGETATLSLAVDTMQTEPYPAGTFSPSGFPGLF